MIKTIVLTNVDPGELFRMALQIATFRIEQALSAKAKGWQAHWTNAEILQATHNSWELMSAWERTTARRDRVSGRQRSLMSTSSTTSN